MSASGDAALLEASLVALGEGGDDLGQALYERFIAAHPEHARAFTYPEAAWDRMTRETLEALVGLAEGAPWVETHVVNFVDLHRNYGDFSPRDYTDWVELAIAEMEARSPGRWPPAASAAWRRQADRLLELVSGELARGRAAAR